MLSTEDNKIEFQGYEEDVEYIHYVSKCVLIHIIKQHLFMSQLGFLALLTAYAYMLLFDYSEDGITYTDYFIIAWMTSFLVDENKQVNI